MPIFGSHVDFDFLLKDVVKNGWAFVLEALNEDFLSNLASEAKKQPFVGFFEAEPVYQCFDVVSPSYPLNNLQYHDLLSGKLGQLVRENSGRIKTLKRWEPNDLAIQRYSGYKSGIDPHRDFASDILLVASFTVVGYGEVRIFSSRCASQPSHILQTGPGSMLLLRAPGLIESEEEVRPTHCVMSPYSETRISSTFRLATVPNKKGAK